MSNQKPIPIYSHSFPSNNLLSVSALRVNDEYEKLIVIFTFVPGEGDKSNRTYNFQRKITMKYTIRELPGISMVLTRAAEGYEKIVLPYTKFTQSNNVTKILNIFPGSIKNTKNGTESRAIIMNISSGDTKFAITLPPHDSYSLGTIIRSIYDHLIQLDIQNYEPKSYQVTKEDQSIPQMKHQFNNSQNDNSSEIPF